jgi:hypothetical protein
MIGRRNGGIKGLRRKAQMWNMESEHLVIEIMASSKEKRCVHNIVNCVSPKKRSQA